MECYPNEKAQVTLELLSNNVTDVSHIMNMAFKNPLSRCVCFLLELFNCRTFFLLFEFFLFGQNSILKTSTLRVGNSISLLLALKAYLLI